MCLDAKMLRKKRKFSYRNTKKQKTTKEFIHTHTKFLFENQTNMQSFDMIHFLQMQIERGKSRNTSLQEKKTKEKKRKKNKQKIIHAKKKEGTGDKGL